MDGAARRRGSLCPPAWVSNLFFLEGSYVAVRISSTIGKSVLWKSKTPRILLIWFWHVDCVVVNHARRNRKTNKWRVSLSVTKPYFDLFPFQKWLLPCSSISNLTCSICPSKLVIRASLNSVWLKPVSWDGNGQWFHDWNKSRLKIRLSTSWFKKIYTLSKSSTVCRSL